MAMNAAGDKQSVGKNRTRTTVKETTTSMVMVWRVRTHGESTTADRYTSLDKETRVMAKKPAYN